MLQPDNQRKKTKKKRPPKEYTRDGSKKKTRNVPSNLAPIEAKKKTSTLDPEMSHSALQASYLLELGREKVPNWDCLFVH